MLAIHPESWKSVHLWPETFPEPDPCQTLIINFLKESIETIFMNFTKSFDVVASDQYLAYFISQGDLCLFGCTHGTELIITRIIFTKLCSA